VTEQIRRRRKKVEAEPPPRRSAIGLELKRSLSQGDRGGQVKMVQDELSRLGFWDGLSDAHYGTRLGKAVRQFQSAQRLRVTGEVNVATWEALFSKEEK
jgi:peptidoglycan hydrolase-like protein with peptidoglycan-binding domain